jgi:ABC-type lipoprotein release transport system permease subunit
MFSPINIRVGFYLALRQIKRSSLWTTSLIVFVMLLTFLNLVVVTGILVGLVEGINNSYRTQYTGDVIISALDTKNYVEKSPMVISFLTSLPQVVAISPRYITSGTVESDYKTRTNENDKTDIVSAQIAGIDPILEDNFSHLSSYLIEGTYLEPDDFDQILIGAQLLKQYSFGEQPGIGLLDNVSVGSKVRLTIGEAQREVVVKGVIDSKVAELSLRAYLPESQLRGIIGRSDYNVAEIPVRLREGSDDAAFRDLLLRSGIGANAKVQTFEDSIPDGVQDITNTFAMLGNMISSVGLVVASITIFIVIFINALTRRKFIGILKGIGIDGRAIEISYMFQSLFYAAIGSGVGLAVLYGFLVPFVAEHPIDFPFSDGILVAPLSDTMIRIALLVVATIIAGYIPARMIVKKNTLDSILGRN